jgi:hypothetical protein
MAMRDEVVYECDNCRKTAIGHESAIEWVLIEEQSIDGDVLIEPTLLCPECYDNFSDAFHPWRDLTLNDTQ